MDINLKNEITSQLIGSPITLYIGLINKKKVRLTYLYLIADFGLYEKGKCKKIKRNNQIE